MQQRKVFHCLIGSKTILNSKPLTDRGVNIK